MSLNFSSRLFLLKSILQTLPIYIISKLATPKESSDPWNYLQIFSLVKVMWQRKWVLVAWDILYLPKMARGHSLHDPKILNNVFKEH